MRMEISFGIVLSTGKIILHLKYVIIRIMISVDKERNANHENF